MKMLSSIKSIDYVVANNDQTPINLIKTLKPNIYCKGKDYINNNQDITGNIRKEIKAISMI